MRARLLGASTSRLGLVANGLNVVPIGTDNKSRILIAVVLRAQTGSLVVFGSRLQRGAIKRIDLLTSLGPK